MRITDSRHPPRGACAAASDSHLDDVAAAQRNYELAQRIGVTPDHVAKRIIRAVQKNQLRIRVGTDAFPLDVLKRLPPVGVQRLVKNVA